MEEEEDLEAVMEAEAQRKFQQAEFEKDKVNVQQSFERKFRKNLALHLN